MDHYSLSDSQFAGSFADCSLDPALFNHEAHLRLAWIHIRDQGIEAAADSLCEQIKRFDRTFGDGQKFHHTLTVAAARAVYHFMQKSPTQDFQSFIRQNPRLLSHFKEILDQHYGFDLLQHPEARHRFVSPDLLPFS